MEIVKNEVLFSRQGKATVHQFVNLNFAPKREPKIKEIDPLPASGIKGLFDKLQKEIEDEDKRIANMPKKLTPSFMAVSRNERDHAFRNKTESPKVGRYSPRFAVIDPRINQAPKIMQKIGSPRKQKIFLPACISHELSCAFPGEHPKPDHFDHNLNRTISHLEDYQERVSKNPIPTPIKLTYRIQSPINLNIQKPRDPFVNPESPPNESRFNFYHTSSAHYSKHRRARTVNFGKMISRKSLHENTSVSPGPYNRNEEALMPRLNLTMMEFDKNLPRKPLVYEHLLRTPFSPDLEKLDKAFFKQSSIRGAYKIPSMQSVSPRDDMMYKTTEAYMLNQTDNRPTCSKSLNQSMTSQ